MYTEAHIVALLAVITEQRARITALEVELEQTKQEEDRNWKWYCEEKEKTSKLEGKVVLASIANQSE